MYKFSEADQKQLYLRHGLQTEIISANHFRQDMFRLQRQFLHPHSCQQKLIESEVEYGRSLDTLR